MVLSHAEVIFEDKPLAALLQKGLMGINYGRMKIPLPPIKIKDM